MQNKFFLFRVDPSSGDGVQEREKKVTKVVSFVKNGNLPSVFKRRRSCDRAEEYLLIRRLFFNQKVSIFFLFLDKNVCCGYSLEVPP